MNISLLQCVAKVINFIAITIISIVGNFNTTEVKEKDLKSLNVVNKVEKYETKYTYNSKLPSNVTNIITEGVDGITYEIDGEIKTLVQKVDEVIEVGTGPEGEYKGVLTEYGPDCYGCNGEGYTYCRTREGTWHSLTKDGIYYNDKYYGKVRILSADHRRFPCGTIIEINNSNYDKMLGIVLDTGWGMQNAYNQGWNLIDLAFETQSKVYFGTNQNTKFSVKRWGW